jgi:hypothetical protein
VITDDCKASGRKQPRYKRDMSIFAARTEIKGKVVPMLKNQTLSHEDVWRGGCIAPQFLTSIRDGEPSASRPGALPVGKEPPAPSGYEVGWAPQPDRHGREERNFLPLPEIEPQPSSPWPVAIPSELSRFMQEQRKTTQNLDQVSRCSG